MKKKICIITSMIYPVPAVKGGAVEGLVELLVRMNEVYKELDLTVISIYDKEAEMVSEKYKNTKFVYIRCNSFIDKFFIKKPFIYINKIWMKLRGRTLISMPFVKRAMKNIKNQKFDKYVLEGGGDCYNFGYLAKKIPEEKLYVHFHGEVPGDKAIQSWFGKCITVSNYIARRLICNGIVESNKVVTLPNCFDKESMESKISRDEIRTRYGIQADDIVFIYWGRLLPEKGVLELIKAYKSLGEDEIVNTKLLILGNASFGIGSHSKYDDELKTLCNNQSLKDKIIFTGFVQHDEMGSVLAACDIGVIPSIWDDPAPLTVFEGLSKGLPLIAGNVGGIPEVINDNDNGLLVRWSENYVIDLSECMKKLKNDSQLRCRLSKQAYSSIESFTPDIYYKRFVNIV